ncbi:MAG: hypothetical protein U0354_01290 [Candidatus Sericytochromatia bacterium]
MNMQNNIIISFLLCTILISCTKDATINIQKENHLEPINDSSISIENNKNSSSKTDKKDTDIVLSNESTQKDTDIVLSNESTQKDTDIVLSNESTQKPINTLVTKPTDNSDPLVTKPSDNTDPDKITSVVSGIGYTNITFAQGINEVNLNVTLSEFKIASTIDETELAETIDVIITINSNPNKNIQLNKDVFFAQSKLIINIKGLKDLEHLKVRLVAKNKDSKVISDKEVMNSPLKGNKAIDTSFYKGKSSTVPQVIPSVQPTPTSQPPSTPSPQNTPNISPNNNQQNANQNMIQNPSLK